MISPQGYKLGEDPTSKNPFWGEGEDSDVNRIFATASVDDGTGVPSVSTSKTVSGNDITFNFDFHNLKGERGPQGPAGATGATGPAGPSGADGAPGATGATGPQGPEGPKGDTGAAGPAGPEGPQGPIGETGPQGPAGPKGDTGAAGPAGADGVSPTAKVEQTGDNEATITITDASGTTSAVLRGEAGAQGPEGPQGPKGDTGETGATGATGATGETGPEGPQGPAGPGVPAGGTAGQVLTKVDGTDYNTEWKDAASGGEINFKIYEVDVNVTSWASDTTEGIYYFEASDSTLKSILLPSAKDLDTTPPIPENKCLSLLVTKPYTSVSAASNTASNFITGISIGTHAFKVGVVGSRTGVVLQAPYQPPTGTYRIKVLYYE